MSTVTNTALERENRFSLAFLPTQWAMRILLALNAIPLLVLPALVGLINGRQFSTTDWLPYFLIALTAIIQAQLFLLAFWMAFAAWPQRWRSLSIFVITIVCGLYCGVSLAAINMLSIPSARAPNAWIITFTMIVLSPIVASGLLWMLSAIFIIPAWLSAYEIKLSEIDRREINLSQINLSETNLREAAPLRVQPKRTFSIPQLIIWTAQVALPLGSLNIVLTITEDRAAALMMITPFVAALISGTPLAIALLKPKLSSGAILAACTWCVLTAAAIYATPASQYNIIPWQTVFVFAITIAANLIALRQLGFSWQLKSA